MMDQSETNLKKSEKRGVSRWLEYQARFKDGYKQAFKGPDRDIPGGMVNFIFYRYVKSIVDAAQKGEPLASTWYGNASEILAAFDIPSYCPVDMVLGNQAFTNDIELSHQGPTPDYTCGLIRQAAIAVTEGLVPTPTMMIAMLEPCDGQGALHELYQKVPEWEDIPVFALDPPYESTDEDYRYFVGELKRMIAWIEETTGKKMDWNKLRRVCIESNKQYALWAELCELQHAVPAPLPSFMIAELLPNLTQHLLVGDPKVTWLLKLMVMGASKTVKKGVGALENEKIRIYWTDLPYAEGAELSRWLGERYGATVVNSTWGEGVNYTQIDTSSNDSMLYGIARRNLNEVPMIRQARGTIDLLLTDVKKATNEYKADCVIFPGHTGHKDMLASVGFLRDFCKEENIPFLALSMDLTDPTWMPIDQVKRTIAEFFEVHGWAPINVD